MGHEVRVVTRENEVLEFKVIGLNADSIFGDTASVRYKEIRTLQRREINAGRTLVALSVAGSLVVLAAMGGSQ